MSGVVKALGLSLLLGLPPPQAEPRDQSSAVESLEQRAMAGEVAVEQLPRDAPGASVRAMVLIGADAETIWRVINSCEKARIYVDGMKDCEILRDTERESLTRQVVDPGWWAPRMEYIFEARRRPYERMDFELREGNMKQLEGYWVLEPVPGGVLVEHELHLQPNFPSPRWLVRRNLERNLPGMMACIRSLSGGSLSEQGGREDRQRCPRPQ